MGCQDLRWRQAGRSHGCGREGGGQLAAGPRECGASMLMAPLFSFANGVSTQRSWDSFFSIFRPISCLDEAPSPLGQYFWLPFHQMA